MHIASIKVENFRAIASTEELALGKVNVFLGGNNSGKTTILKALLLAKFGVGTLLRRMVAPKDSIVRIKADDPRILQKTTLYVAQGNLAEYSDLPVLDAESLFRLRDRGRPIKIYIKWENLWAVTLEFSRPSGTSITIEPKEITLDQDTFFTGQFRKNQNGNRSVDLTRMPPDIRQQFLSTLMDFATSGPILVPASVGMPLEEELVNYGKVTQLIAGGRVNLTVRNIIRSIRADRFALFQRAVSSLFGVNLERPTPNEEEDVSISLPYHEDKPGAHFNAEVAELGSGTQQIVYLLALMYRNSNATQFLLDEPDAHLHPYFISQLVNAMMYQVHQEGKQVFVATHSNILLGTLRHKAPALTRVVSCDARGGAVEVTEASDLVRHLYNIGYDSRLPHTLEIVRNSGRVALVEGTFDEKMIKALVSKVDSALGARIEEEVAFLPLRGTGRSRIALIGGVSFLADLMGTLRWRGLLVIDRDFEPPAHTGPLDNALTRAASTESAGNVRQAIVHRVYCVENYLTLDEVALADACDMTLDQLHALLMALRRLHDTNYITEQVRYRSDEAKKLFAWAGVPLPARSYEGEIRDHLENMLLGVPPWPMLANYHGRRLLGHIILWRTQPANYVPTALDPGVSEEDTTTEFLRILGVIAPSVYARALAPLVSAFEQLLA